MSEGKNVTKGRTLEETIKCAENACNACEDCREEVDAVIAMLHRELATCESTEYECGLAYEAIEEILKEQMTPDPHDAFRNRRGI